MDMESQKILFALSTPMEIRNECCLPSHSSPKMYLGTCFFDLSSSWGIDARDDLLRTIHRMIDNGHAARLAGFYHRWFRYSPCEWRDYLAELNEQGQAYAQFVASTAECCGEGGIKAWDYVRMGFLSRMGVLNNWLSEEESLWIQCAFIYGLYVIIVTGGNTLPVIPLVGNIGSLPKMIICSYYANS